MSSDTLYAAAVIDDTTDRCQFLFGPEFFATDAHQLAELRQAVLDEKPLAKVDLEEWVGPHIDRLIESMAVFEDATIPRPLLHAVISVLVNQLLDDDPPEAWRAAQRMLAKRLTPDDARLSLIVTLGAFLTSAAQDHEISHDDLVFAYDALPAAVSREVVNAVIDSLHEQPGSNLEELILGVEQRCGGETGVNAGGLADPVRDVIEELEVDGDGPLVTLSDGRMVFLPAVADGQTFTHVLTDTDLLAESIDASVDLVALVGHYELGLDGPIHDPLDDESEGDSEGERRLDFSWSSADGVDNCVLSGPGGWLGEYLAGQTITFRASLAGHVAVETISATPAVNVDLVAVLRSAYESEPTHEESGIPVNQWLARVFLSDPHAFRQPQAPLSTLIEAGGLRTYDGHVVETDDQILAIDRRNARAETLEVFGPLVGPRVVDVMQLLDDSAPSRERLDRALTTITAEGVLAPLVAQLLLEGGSGIGRERARTEAERQDYAALVAGRIERLADRLAEVARTPQGWVAVHVLRARASEHRGDPITAEAHVGRAQEADRRSPDVADLVGWYASDRGNWVVSEAALSFARMDDDLTGFMSSLTRTLDRRHPRNAKCFCGSGKKFKACHLGQPDTIPLSERAPWLWMKAVAFLTRSATFAGPALAEMAGRMLGEDGWDLDEPFDLSDVSAVMDDPVTADLLLVEEGWFERFLAARGPLLPADERELARAWLPLTRSVYDVLAVTDSTTVVRDTLADCEIAVAKIRHAKVEDLFVGRVVPDGQGGHLLLGHGVCVHEDNDLADVQRWVRESDLDALATFVGGNDRVGG